MSGKIFHGSTWLHVEDYVVKSILKHLLPIHNSRHDMVEIPLIRCKLQNNHKIKISISMFSVENEYQE